MTGPMPPGEPAGGPYRAQAVDGWDLAVQSDDQFRLLGVHAWWWLTGVGLLGLALLVWAATTPSSAPVAVEVRIDDDTGRTATVLVPEKRSAALAAEQPIMVGDVPQVSGRVTSVSAPLVADVAARRTGLVPADSDQQVILTVALDGELPPASRQQAVVITSQRSVLDRILGRV